MQSNNIPKTTVLPTPLQSTPGVPTITQSITEGITNQICSGTLDKSCGEGYQCVQGCGAPVVRENEPTPPYYCMVNELAQRPRECPICLASSTKIATPIGDIAVTKLKAGMKVWSQNEKGERIISTIMKTSQTAVPRDHMMIHLQLSDGREFFVSPGHPTIDGSTVGELKTGDNYDSAVIQGVTKVPYTDTMTYDLLPDSPTGYYWANGILLGSTLKRFDIHQKSTLQ